MKAKKNKREWSAQMRQVSAGLRDVLGMTKWRKQHPNATFREIEAAVPLGSNEIVSGSELQVLEMEKRNG